MAEAVTVNNHSVWYADQVVSYALYTGQTALAQQVLRSAEAQLVAKQIRPDGTQPFELTRTDSWSYSTYNVEAFARLAELGSAGGVDLWDYQAPSGASIRKALDYVASYGTRLSAWPYKQGRTATLSYLVLPLYAAGVEFNDPAYTALGATAAAATSTFYPSGPVLYYK
jgi:Alginate lyase